MIFKPRSLLQFNINGKGKHINDLTYSEMTGIQLSIVWSGLKDTQDTKLWHSVFHWGSNITVIELFYYNSSF